MKHFLAKPVIATVLLINSFSGSLAAQEGNPIISSDAFLKLAGEAMAVRENRLLSEAHFLEYSKQPGTVILDNRSKKKYDKLHVKGAIHLNFSDFNEKSLRKVIPNKTTLLLIYCNNNFKVENTAKTDQHRVQSKQHLNSLTAQKVMETKHTVDINKLRHQGSLALNLSTYLTLHGYGYKNVHDA